MQNNHGGFFRLLFPLGVAPVDPTYVPPGGGGNDPPNDGIGWETGYNPFATPTPNANAGFALLSGGSQTYPSKQTRRAYNFADLTDVAKPNTLQFRENHRTFGNYDFNMIVSGDTNVTLFSTKTESLWYATDARVFGADLSAGRKYEIAQSNRAKGIISSGDISGTTHTNTSEKYDFALNTRAVGAVALGAKKNSRSAGTTTLAFVFGGNSSDGNVRAEVEKYSYSADTWQAAGPLSAGFSGGICMGAPTMAVRGGPAFSSPPDNAVKTWMSKYDYATETQVTGWRFYGNINSQPSTSNPTQGWIGAEYTASGTFPNRRYNFADDSVTDLNSDINIEARLNGWIGSSNPGGLT